MGLFPCLSLARVKKYAARLSQDLESAQAGNNKMEAISDSKLLNYNLDKSCFLFMGNKLG